MIGVYCGKRGILTSRICGDSFHDTTLSVRSERTLAPSFPDASVCPT
jgi:hypothetical protein